MLVVESDPETQWQLARTLTVHGNRVVGTSSADGAIALIRAWPVDVALIGDLLPAGTALELAGRLREIQPSVRVALMIEKQSRELQIAARLAGVVALIAKPFRPEVMSEVLTGIVPPVFGTVPAR